MFSECLRPHSFLYLRELCQNNSVSRINVRFSINFKGNPYAAVIIVNQTILVVGDDIFRYRT